MLIVEHTGDNNLIAFRFRNPDCACWPRKRISKLAGHKFRAGAFIIPNADRASLEPQLKELGLSAWAVSARRRRSRPTR